MSKLSKAFIAKYPNKCPKCKNNYKVGKDYLRYVDGIVQHVECPDKSNRHGVNEPLPIETNPIFDADSLALAIAKPEIIVETKVFNPSKYQLAIFDAMFKMIENVLGFRHLVVEAVAGSGKTTTLIEGIKRLIERFPYLSIRIIAFNKPIADDFETKLTNMLNFLGLDSDVHASTMHSLGLAGIRKINPKVKVDDKGEKMDGILEQYYPVTKRALEEGKITKVERKENYAKRLSMRKLVSICKSTLVDTLDGNAVKAIIDRYNVEIDMAFIDNAISTLPEIMEQCKNNTDLVDFDDMPWMPVVLDLDIDKFDVLMVDEAQDLSIGNTKFALKCIKPDGHIIAVGDRRQSLYGFRGADTEAIPNIIKALNATVLPLSVTYRCPSSHVELARQIVTQLEARDNAPVGYIGEVKNIDLVSMLQSGDMVICRTNAPLVQPAFECIRQGKKAIIRGKDIGQSLVNLIKRFETDDLEHFELALFEYFHFEHTKLMDKGKEMQAILLQDRVETLHFIMKECKTVSELMSRIMLLFDDNQAGIVFSSVHRAKGLEAENVFILRKDLMPHPKAKREWEKTQELNAEYVAETRSKNNLYFVTGGENV